MGLDVHPAHLSKELVGKEPYLKYGWKWPCFEALACLEHSHVEFPNCRERRLQNLIDREQNATAQQFSFVETPLFGSPWLVDL